MKKRILLPIAAALLAASVAVPSQAQVGGVTAVGVAPGMAVGSRTITATATVAAIDMATRQVTLRRGDGTTFNVIAGPQVQNLPQLRIGDTVTLDYIDVLTLELKKGGTGAGTSIVRRTDATRAELGQRPGGAVVKETKIVADVVAVDSLNQRVTVRGPQGNQVTLPVQDRAQFDLIRVGDQIEADYVEAAAVSITPAAKPAPVAVPAAAPWGRWMIGARLVDVSPDVSSSLSGFDVKDQWTGEIDSTYFFTPNIAVEGSITWAKQDVTFNGTGVGALKMMPVTFTLQYHFTDLGAWKPYVGGGFNYTYFYENDLGNNAGASVNSNSWGGALQAGLDYQFERNWYVNFDVKYLWIDNDVRLNNFNSGNISSLDIDPWVFGVGIRYRF